MAKFIYVQSTQGDRVGLYEKNPAHPNGEVFVNGDNVVKVAQTPAVTTAIARGRIVSVDVVEQVDEEDTGTDWTQVRGIGNRSALRIAHLGFKTIEDLKAAYNEDPEGTAQKILDLPGLSADNVNAILVFAGLKD